MPPLRRGIRPPITPILSPSMRWRTSGGRIRYCRQPRRGAQFLSETISQYSAIMTVQEKYGEAEARKFLQHYAFEYLNERGSEKTGRKTAENSAQPAISFLCQRRVRYVRLAALLSREPLVDSVLRAFVHRHAFQENPYVTSAALIDQAKSGRARLFKIPGERLPGKILYCMIMVSIRHVSPQRFHFAIYSDGAAIG